MHIQRQLRLGSLTFTTVEMHLSCSFFSRPGRRPARSWTAFAAGTTPHSNL
jgi:hypothetical protein